MADEADSKLFKLKKAVAIGDLTYAELTARELTIGEWKTASAGKAGFDADVSIIAMATGAPPAVIEKLSLTDFRGIQKYVTSFWDDGQDTGSKP